MEVPAGFHHFTGYVSPLRNATSLKEIEEYEVEDPARLDCAHFPETVRKAHEAGCPAVIFPGHMYENSWQVRGYEPFLEDMIERPAWAECMLDKYFRYNLHVATLAAKAGADLIQCGDDVANQRALMFSPPMWRKFILSRWSQVWRAVKAINPDVKTHYHSDGNVNAIVEEMVEAGLDILNPVQPECVDTDEIHRKWGARLSFDGCIGTQTTMPFGTPDQVRARVKECIEKYGRNGGLILSPTHVLEPEVPIANIEAFVEACKEYGTFA
jgi:uroporphyrinogen decarboxylase